MVATTRPVSVDLPRLSSVVLEEYAFFNVQHVELRSGRRGRMRRRRCAAGGTGAGRGRAAGRPLGQAEGRDGAAVRLPERRGVGEWGWRGVVTHRPAGLRIPSRATASEPEQHWDADGAGTGSV